MSIYETKIEGREFDWIALDCVGNIAIFSTGGEGFVPEEVISFFKLYDEIVNSLESPNWGSAEVWSDYSNVGFFVFDWQLHGGPYSKQCEPNNEMETELKMKILGIPEIMKFDFRFSDVKNISAVECGM